MIAEHSDRLYSTNMLFQSSLWRAIACRPRSPVVTAPRAPVTRFLTRHGHQGERFSPELSVVATPTPAPTETPIHLHERAGVIQSP